MFGKIMRMAAVGAIVGTLAFQAIPAFAASGPTTLTVAAPTQVNQGTSFNVTVQVNSSGTFLGDQFGLSFDSTKLQANSVTDGTMLSSYATSTGGTALTASPWTISNSAGTIAVGADAVMGSSGSGATGTGTLLTINFTALSGAANGYTAISLTPVSSTGTQLTGINNSDITVQNANVIVGTVPQPDLTVSNASTVSTTSPAGSSFNVKFQVNNIGTASAGANTATVAVTGATPASINVPVASLAAGANSGTLTAGPFTLATGSSLANVTITADSANVVVESNKTNNTASTAYQYSALGSSGNTPVSASLAAFLNLTAPPAISGWVLTAGQMNDKADSYANVKSNVDFSVTISGDNNGLLSEYDGAAYVSGGAQLINPIVVQLDSTTSHVNVSGIPQVFVTGTRAGSDPVNGISYPTTFHQMVGFNDKPVNAPHTYYEVLTFAASGTF